MTGKEEKDFLPLVFLQYGICRPIHRLLAASQLKIPPPPPAEKTCLSLLNFSHKIGLDRGEEVQNFSCSPPARGLVTALQSVVKLQNFEF